MPHAMSNASPLASLLRVIEEAADGGASADTLVNHPVALMARQAVSADRPLSCYRVHRSNGVIFLPLPPSMWQPGLNLSGGCICGHCDGRGMWDTLAFHEKPPRHAEQDTPWRVHFPELQPR